MKRSCLTCCHLSATDCGKVVPINYNGGVKYEKQLIKCKGYEVKTWGYLKDQKK